MFAHRHTSHKNNMEFSVLQQESYPLDSFSLAMIRTPCGARQQCLFTHDLCNWQVFKFVSAFLTYVAVTHQETNACKNSVAGTTSAYK